MQGRAPKKDRYRGGKHCSVVYYKFTEQNGLHTLHASNLPVKEAVREADALFRKLKKRGLRHFAVTVELPPLRNIHRRIYQLNRYETKTERINRVGLVPFEWEPTDGQDNGTAAEEFPVSPAAVREARRRDRFGRS